MTNGEVLARFPLREPSADPDQGVCQLPEEGLCKSYTALLARSSAILKNFPIPTVTGRITVRSVQPIALLRHTASTGVRWLTSRSMA